ncbi:hypothetical protein F2P81_014118 [Scophthalmus maximus]|uniref:COMM domain-containing protein n=1 Tax=Scophthalmus maximus TaxID=52904 RepID=A0A6A4SVD7_SCOMX|nr:hypothetical protein F2P81_014118 [Scophthalmus maximus]
MIRAILIFNNHGKPRLSKFYEHYSEDTEQQIIRETFHLVSKRDENVCNFLEGGMLIGGSDYKLIYRHYATLYFVFCVDSSESELGILDLIQVFVETLDKCFENVCELDLIFHVDKVHNILAEMVMGGMVLETNMNEIIMQVDAQNKMEKSEGERTFSEEEEQKLEAALSLDKQALNLVLETAAFILEQAVYHNVKPAALQQQLEAVHLNSDKAEVFSQSWATAGPELLEKLKHNTFAPKKLEYVGWQLNLQMAQSSQARLKSPSAILQLGLRNDDSEVRTQACSIIYLMTCYGFYANTWVKPVVDLDTFIAAVSENRKKLKQNTASNSLRIDSHVYSKMPSAVLLLLCYFDHRPLGRRFYRGPPSPLIAQCGRRILRGSAEESGRTFPNPGRSRGLSNSLPYSGVSLLIGVTRSPHRSALNVIRVAGQNTTCRHSR